MFYDYGSIDNCEGELYPRSWVYFASFYCGPGLAYLNYITHEHRIEQIKTFKNLFSSYNKLDCLFSFAGFFCFETFARYLYCLVKCIGMTMVDRVYRFHVYNSIINI